MLKALFLLIAGSVVLACFLTPPVFEAIIYLFDKSPWPYSRVFDRVVMVCACVILWIERRAFKLKELAPYFTGLSKWTGARHLALGLLLSLGCVAMLLPLVVRDGELYWIDRPDGFYTKRVPEVIIGAVLLSVIEEMLFRAIIFVQTARKVGVWLGAVFSSVFYAVVHFLSPVKTWQYTGFSVGVGFDYLAKVLERLIMPGTLPGVFGLFMIGMVLCFDRNGAVFRFSKERLYISLHRTS
ncbi:MAG: hypothetical protein DCC75_12405 [Proteobacteria bacterium]|nr:MAG: hypothetical protein DCC75_12405 [Pseudomonadota bacterium]